MGTFLLLKSEIVVVDAVFSFVLAQLSPLGKNHLKEKRNRESFADDDASRAPFPRPASCASGA